MVYKGDENYEDYLKIRLGSQYNKIYENGLPENYTNSSLYSIQPEEILADDFVELFYDTSVKVVMDTYDYELKYTDTRQSLKGEDIQILKNTDGLGQKELKQKTMDKKATERKD